VEQEAGMKKGPLPPPPEAPTVVRYHREDGCVLGIAAWDGKRIRMAIFDSPVRLLIVDPTEMRYITPLDLKVPRAAKRMRAAGKRLGITDGARKFLSDSTLNEMRVTFLSEL
jgi:hypothetical protein